MQAYDKQALAPEHCEPVGAKPKSRIFGLSKKVFLIVLVVILLVVVVEAVGGGAGGALTSKDNSIDTSTPASQTSGTPLPVAYSSTSAQPTSSPIKSAPSSSITSTSTSSTKTTSTSSKTSSINTPTSIAAALAVLGFPSANGTTYTPSGSSSSFLKYYMQDLQTSGSTTATVDIRSRAKASFDAYINSCAEYTEDWIARGKAGVGPCAGATMNTLIPG